MIGRIYGFTKDFKVAFDILVTKAFQGAQNLLGERGAEYNQGEVCLADYFPGGIQDHRVILFVKILRMRSRVAQIMEMLRKKETGGLTKEEIYNTICLIEKSQSETLDIMNYGSFFWAELSCLKTSLEGEYGLVGKNDYRKGKGTPTPEQ
jgi:hypothetical protein